MELTLKEITVKNRDFGPVSLRLKPGEILFLCGLSGSGKSTLCDVISGRLDVSAGEVLGAESFRLGYVAHDFENQLVGGTVSEELEIGRRAGASVELAPSGLERAVEILQSRIGCESDRDPHDIPASTQQYLLLASLLLSGSRYFILDESLSHLCQRTRSELVECLQWLRDEGYGILLVSHEPVHLSLADRVVLMESGRVAFDGPTDEFTDCLQERAGFYAEETRLEAQTQDSHDRVLEAAYRDFELTVPPGRYAMLGGFSGSGKSVALAQLFGLEAPGPWERRVLSEARCLLRQHVGPSFWRASLAKELKASRGRFGELSQELTECLSSAIPDYWGERAPWQLSHGQLRFFAVCCLVSQNPKVLLLDQPFRGLDGPLRRTLRQVLSQYLKSGGSLLYSTHELAEAEASDALVCWLEDDGQVSSALSKRGVDQP